MTPKDLAAELLRRGYGKSQEGNERLLTDWRFKDLMPELISRGRGQGPGRLNFSTEADIVDRAIAIFDLFAANQPADAVLIALWLLEFDAPINRVRETWLRLWHSKLEARIPSEVMDTEKREDMISDLVDPVTQRMSRVTGVKRKDIASGILEAADVLLNSTYKFDEVAEQSLIDSVTAFVAKKNLFGNLLPFMNEIDLRPTIGLLATSQSVDGVKDLISSASDNDLVYALQLWHDTWELLSKFLPHSQEKMPGLNLTRGQHWKIVGGRHAIPAFLYFINLGFGERIERTVSAIKTALGEFELIESATAALVTGKSNPNLKKLISDLSDIWDFSKPPPGSTTN